MPSLIQHYALLVSIILFASVLVACTSAEPAVVVELDTDLPSATPRIIYVTPTREASPIPTFAIPSETPPPTQTIEPTMTVDVSAVQTQCQQDLIALYTTASEACLGEPSGFFCNGGGAPRPQTVTNVADVSTTMSEIGSLVPLDVVTGVRTPSLYTSSNEGGIMWVRLDAPIDVNALMLGDVHVRDITPSDIGLTPWQALSVVTDDTTATNLACQTQPSTFIAQGPWGRSTSFAVNGVSIELTGSIAVQTRDNETIFIAIEGQSNLNIFGQTRVLFAGQQLNVPYNEGNYDQPAGVPGAPTLLNFGFIADIPVELLDRPVLLPQPGNARTNGNVNLRASDSVDSLLLAEVPDGQTLSIIGMNLNRTWYHIRLPNGDNGWMRADLLTGDIGDVSVTYEATPLPPERLGNTASGGIVIAGTGANLRRAPDVQFDVLRTLPEGTEVELIARSPYSPFVKVDTGTEIGWLALITLETTSVIQFLPVDYDVPLPPGPTPTPYFAFGGGHAYPDPRAGN